ncbi:hypothetical protein CHARACLAT_024380 [Characodon lateralis]|uniref:Uncharacterized protein n=1 Tax=Characodon lateralis TaxID=208331 RepID=A0ABU7ED33_9TELE|nr:hypothetical protein [Characodon lateralis]
MQLTCRQLHRDIQRRMCASSFWGCCYCPKGAFKLKTPLVDTSENHSGSAMLMLLSVVVAGLAVFVIYKFKRKIPGLNVYAQMQNDKEPEMMSPANPSEATPSSQQDLVPSLEILDTECNSRPIGCKKPHVHVKFSTEHPTYIV